jgi:hypothetical protein
MFQGVSRRLKKKSNEDKLLVLRLMQSEELWKSKMDPGKHLKELSHQRKNTYHQLQF